MDDRIVYWEDQKTKELILSVLSIFDKKGVACGVLDTPGFISEDQEAFSKRSFEFRGLDVHKWINHISLRGEEESQQDGWLHGFPHRHDGWDNSLTMVQFLQAPESGGELVVCPNTKDEVVVKPEVGLCAFCKDSEMHGVKNMVGNTYRISLMVTGFYN